MPFVAERMKASAPFCQASLLPERWSGPLRLVRLPTAPRTRAVRARRSENTIRTADSIRMAVNPPPIANARTGLISIGLSPQISNCVMRHMTIAPIVMLPRPIISII